MPEAEVDRAEVVNWLDADSVPHPMSTADKSTRFLDPEAFGRRIRVLTTKMQALPVQA